MKRFLYTLVFTLCVLCMNAQTLWTGAVSNDWNDAANWTAGIPTSGQTATLPIMEGGNSPIYGGSPVIDFTIQNAGTLTFNTVVFNNGTIINFGGGIINNNNYFINAGSMVFDNDGVFNNDGVFDNFGTYEHAASAELNNLGTFNSLGDFNSNGPISNEGSFSVSGKFITTQKLENTGTLTVTGFVDFPFGSELVNAASGEIRINANAKLQINSPLTNAGLLVNNGSFSVQSASTLTNTGVVRNNASLELSGKIMNENNFVNRQGIMIKSGGQLENRDRVNNQGEITMEICAVLIQDSGNNIEGSIQTDGLTYEISGTANETNLEFGETFTDINQTPSPQAACKSDNFFFLDESGVVEFTAADIDRGRSYGSCGAELVEITVSPTSFTAADAGVRIVELTVTDNFGRTATCQDFVTIVPYAEPITASNSAAIDSDCGENITASTLPGANFAEVSFPAPVATSSCSGMPVTTIDCSSTPDQINGLIFMGERNGSKYYCSNTNNLTWHQARDLAINLGGHLATVNDAGENEFIRSNILADYAWIGYNDEAQEGNFEWVSGDSDYVNWRSGEPNNSNGTEHFARILKGSGEWTDRNEHFQAEAVIEIPCPVVMENSCSVAPEVDGMMYLGTFDNSHYYKKPDGDLEYNAAKAFVESRGGNLPVISSEAENTFLRNAAGDGRYWLALTDENQEGTFAWTTGASVSYTNWNQHEPNDYGSGEDYTQVLPSGLWNDVNAHRLNWAIMEIPCQANTGSTICSLDNYGTEGTAERIVWIKADNENATYFETVGENTFQEFSDGTAVLTGKVQEQGNSNRRYSFSVKLENKRTYAEWTGLGRLVKEESTPYGDPTTWSFYELAEGESTFTGEGSFAGQTLNLTHAPTDYSYGFQVGFGANVKDSSFGISGWWNFSGSRNGRGDFNADLNNCTILPGGNGEVTVTQIQGIQSGDNFPVGTTQVAYRISDDCGNEEICLFDVVVEATPSELTLTNCSGDIVVDAPICEEGTIVSWELPSATTTCYINDIIVDRVDENPSSGEFFPIGTTTISYIVADSCGNAEVCVFNVIVNEVEGELSVNCVEDITVTAARNETAAVVNFAAPTGTTTGSGVTVRQLDGPESGQSLAIGSYSVIFLISDDCNNTELCTFNITVEPTVIDDDNDGVPAEEDCDDNDASIPAAPGTTCDDGDVNTENDIIDTDGCTCIGTLIIDADGDGVRAEEDCDDNDASIPTAPGTACNDGDDNTENDVIAADGCTCGGEAIVDADGDGVRAEEDCDDNDASIPTAPGTACNDNNSLTENDIIGADGCSCAGTLIPTCTVAGGEIAFLDGSTEQTICADDQIANPLDVNVFGPIGTNQQWVITDADLNILGLPTAPPFDLEGAGAGTCLIWNLSFEDGLTGATVGANAGDLDGCFELSNPISVIRLTGADCPNFIVDADGDGIAADEDCDDNDPSIPTTPGTACDDFNANTENDVILSDGCGCSGTPIIVIVDNDGDGVPAGEDCDDNDPSVPATPGTACDDGNADTENDVVTADGCGCEGTPVVVTGPDCADISITTGNGSFTVTGLDGAPVSSVQCFNALWQEEYKCFGDCEATITEVVTPGSYRIFVKYYTASYQLICTVEEVVEVTEGQPVDADGDGVPASEDCDDNDPSVPTTPGTACDDGNADTENDVILANGCDCAGTNVNGPTDADGDGVPADEDCDDNDPSVPATPGTACDDGNADTENDVVTADGCGCEGTPVVVTGPDCADISITAGNGSFTVTGLDGAPVSSVQCFNSQWQEEYKCFGDCEATITEVVTPGSYRIFVKYYTASYQLICTVEEVVEVTEGQPVDADGDGVPASEDCDDNDPSVPTTPGTACDDLNADTENDVILANGCDCAGTNVNGPTDADGDGVPADEDCDDNDPSVPATPGTACDDGNADTENDVVTADGCGCEGTPVVVTGPDCADISITAGNGSFTVTGLDGAPVTSVQCFNAVWQEEYKCFGDCEASITEVVAPGSYRIFVKYYTASYQLICTVEEVVEVTGNPIVDNDNDGVPASEDCDDNDASIPTTPGTICNDGNDDTVNDVILANGCDCAGTLVVDNDGDGVPADEDCDDNDALVPAAPGTSCDDGNPATNNDVLLANGCDCAGTLFVDNDGDGVPADEDCDDNNPAIPAAPGTACNDNNPNTVNDVILADGCDCAGEVAPVDVCTTRTASNVINCANDVNYGGWLRIDGASNHYTLSNSELVEYEDGTALFTGTWTNNQDASLVFDFEINASGKTTTAPTGSPKEHRCLTPDYDAFYYYADFSGILSGRESVAGAQIAINTFGAAFQLGVGANATGTENTFGASAWFSGEIIQQPTNGSVITLDPKDDGHLGDINIKLSGNVDDCSDINPPVDVCTTRTASNIVNCRSDINYGGWLRITGASYYYTVSNSELVEYADGTALFTGTWTNNEDPSLVFDFEINASGKTTTAPADSPKEHICLTPDYDAFYYYADFSGILSGRESVAGAQIAINTFGAAFQLGVGANATGTESAFGASAWYSGEVIQQPSNGHDITLNPTSDGHLGDININLTGNADDCDNLREFVIAPNASYLHLNAIKLGSTVGLDWTSNNDYRTALNIIERSENGTDWMAIEEAASLTQSTNATFYQSKDEQPAFGVNHYRIKQIMNDGTFIYSNVAKVRFDVDPAKVVVYPNPTVEELNISLVEYAGHQGTLRIANALGQKMYEVSYDEIPTAPVHIELNQAYQAGTYTIMVTIDGRKPVTKFFIVSKL